MTSTNLRRREYFLSLWAQDRLGERKTVEWATTALKQIRGDLGADTVALFDFLDRHAHESERLPPAIKKVWRLLKIVATDRADRESISVIYDFKRKIDQGNPRLEDIDQFVECVRPRLRATELSSWAKAQEEVSDDPMRWVSWEFENSLHSSYQQSARLSRSQYNKIPLNLLLRQLERGTSALETALSLARDIGWLGEERDLPNHLVHRVFMPESQPRGRTASEDDKDRDPDSLNDDFAPIVRLLSSTLNTLAQKLDEATNRIIDRWKEQPGGLFLRLFAFACWNPNLKSGQEVAAFLEGVNNHAFWRWIVFPEIASLRALRWSDLPADAKSRLEARLLNGPNNDAFRSDHNIPESAIIFHRDHELARLVDAGLDVTEEFGRLVNARRERNSEFPRHIPSIEPGLPGARVSTVPEGSPNTFNAVPDAELLAALIESHERHHIGEGNDAEAFARTLTGKRRILERLAAAILDNETAASVWQLLLSYPHEKTEDAIADREVAEQTAKSALNLSQELLGRLAGQLCYWLDGTEEKIPKFVGADQLWSTLLPYAAELANGRGDAGATGDIEGQADLTMAALNEPLGHLLSFFLRRCPTMPAEGERPPLPSDFTVLVKRLAGRAKELLANRMAIQMNYFARADSVWLDEVVIEPMTLEGRASDRIWEAFAKYGRVPPPGIWRRLQSFVFRRLSSSRLSPEAKRHLGEMSVIIWFWTKEGNNLFGLDAANLRSALGLASGDVRAAVAWRFSTFFHSENDQEESNMSPAGLWRKVGPDFFKEVWPLEPTLQSSATANDFARIPAHTGPAHFADAVSTVLPYLQPFEVWSTSTEFELDPKERTTNQIVETCPKETLTLLAACISEHQRHIVFDLKKILDQIVAASPDLQRDHRMRRLRKLAADSD
jgi:hypothetical protein